MVVAVRSGSRREGGQSPRGLAFVSIFALSLLALVGTAVPSVLLSIAALLIFGAYYALIARSHIFAAMIIMPFFLYRLSSVGSLVAIEAGGEMPEIAQVGFYNNSTILFCIIGIIGIYICSLFLSDDFVARQRGGGQKSRVAIPITLVSSVAIALVATSTVYLLFLGLDAGFPLLKGVDRFWFKSTTNDYLFGFILGNRYLIATLCGLGIAFSRSNSSKARVVVSFLVFIFMLFLFAEKFFSIITTFVFFMIPLVYHGRAKIGISSILTGAVLLVICSSVTYYIYSRGGELPAEVVMEKLSNRFSSQGQLFYAAVNNGPVGIPALSQVADMLKAIVTPGSEKYAFYNRTGMFYVMSLFAPSSRWAALALLNGFVTFAMGTEAYWVLLGGLPLCFFAMSVMFCIFGLILKYAAYSMFTGDVVRIALSIKFIAYGLDALNQVGLWSMFGWRMLILIIICGAYEWWSRGGTHSRQRVKLRPEAGGSVA